MLVARMPLAVRVAEFCGNERRHLCLVCIRRVSRRRVDFLMFRILP